MLVQVNADSNIEGSSERSQWIEAQVTSAPDRFGDQIRRV